MRRSRAWFTALLLPLFLPAGGLVCQAHVRLGVDRFADSLPKILVDKRVGLITNHTGRDRASTPSDAQRFSETRKPYLLY
jgi:uncharacterized protein YbbC (DUF1343 family)